MPPPTFSTFTQLKLSTSAPPTTPCSDLLPTTRGFACSVAGAIPIFPPPRLTSLPLAPLLVFFWAIPNTTVATGVSIYPPTASSFRVMSPLTRTPFPLPKHLILLLLPTMTFSVLSLQRLSCLPPSHALRATRTCRASVAASCRARATFPCRARITPPCRAAASYRASATASCHARATFPCCTRVAATCAAPSSTRSGGCPAPSAPYYRACCTGRQQPHHDDTRQTGLSPTCSTS